MARTIFCQFCFEVVVWVEKGGGGGGGVWVGVSNIVFLTIFPTITGIYSLQPSKEKKNIIKRRNIFSVVEHK